MGKTLQFWETLLVLPHLAAPTGQVGGSGHPKNAPGTCCCFPGNPWLCSRCPRSQGNLFVEFIYFLVCFGTAGEGRDRKSSVP